jgi:hypothetical protein
MKWQSRFLVILGACVVCSVYTCVQAADVTKTFAIESLDGLPLSTKVLNDKRAEKKLDSLNDEQFRNSFRVSAEDMDVAAIFDTATGKMTVTFRNVDPKNLRATVSILAQGLLDDVVLQGIAIAADEVAIVMPLANHPCCCSCHRRCRW